MAAADLADAADEPQQTSITGTSPGNSRPQEAIEAPKMESHEESKDVSTLPSARNEQAVAEEKEGETKAAMHDQDEDEDVEYPHGAKLWIILMALCLAIFLVALDQTIIATAIPKITDHFNSIQDIGWYGSSYLLTGTALQPTFGRIYTIFSVSYSLCIFITAWLASAHFSSRSNTRIWLPSQFLRSGQSSLRIVGVC